MGQVKDITGKKFGMLTVLRQDGHCEIWNTDRKGSDYCSEAPEVSE